MDATERTPAVQEKLEGEWRKAIAQTEEGMETIRSIHPRLTAVVDELDTNRFGRALDGLERAYAELHLAGKGVLGQDEYTRFLEEETERRASG